MEDQAKLRPELGAAVVFRCPRCKSVTWQLLLEDPDSDTIHCQCNGCGTIFEIDEFSPGHIKENMPWF